MKWTSGSTSKCVQQGCGFRVCALKDFKAWRISQPFRSCEMSVRGYEMALVCQRVHSQLRNTLRNRALAAKIGDFTLWGFRSHFAAAKWSYCAAKWHTSAKRWFRSCENFRRGGVGLRNLFRSGGPISQPNLDFAADGHFRRGLFWAAKFRRPLKFLGFELLLAL